MKYRREVDGLRAIAVLAVILFHAGFTTFEGGFIGVDIFFVISGYLISDLLIRDIEKGEFSLREFYARRIRRIFPALFTITLIAVPISWCLMLPPELNDFGKSLISIPTFTSNIYFWRDTGYFQVAAEATPLLHTWSLAVEEQFYLLFPLLMLFLWRLGRKFRLVIIVFLLLGSLTLAQILSASKPTAAFFLLPTRGWEFIIGTLAALIARKKTFASLPKFFFRFGGFIGLILVLISILTFNDETITPGFITIIPTIGTILIILFSTQDTTSGKWLGNRVLVGLGVISYSAYLLHQPVFVFARYLHPEVNELFSTLLIIIILGLSFLSWKYIEQPFRRPGRVKSSFVGTLTVISVGLTLITGIITSSLNTNFENSAAKLLKENTAIFAVNMDERLFVKNRVQYEDMHPDNLIIGSSRAMQISNFNSSGSNLNLSVSGASLEDLIAISYMASKKYEPEKIYISADPWLFNSNNGENRWSSISDDYEEAIRLINGRETLPRSESEHLMPFNSFFSDVYNKLNSRNISSPDDEPGLIDKIRHDGSRVYNIEYASQPTSVVERNSLSALSYGMNDYRFSRKRQLDFESFLLRLREDFKVTLILSPYHPKAFREIQLNRLNFIEIEKTFRDISRRTKVNIIGSYNPKLSNCAAEEFYDGMHPRESCMTKILSNSN